MAGGGWGSRKTGCRYVYSEMCLVIMFKNRVFVSCFCLFPDAFDFYFSRRFRLFPIFRVLRAAT